MHGGTEAAAGSDQLRRHARAEARDRAAEHRDLLDEQRDRGEGPGAEQRRQSAIDRLHAGRDRDEDA